MQQNLNSSLCFGTPSFPGHLPLNVRLLSAKLIKQCIPPSGICAETLASFIVVMLDKVSVRPLKT